MKSHSSNLTQRLIRAALRSACNYRVSAAAFDYRGRIIGIATNQPRQSTISSRQWHAEELLIHRLPRSLVRIEIVRVGARGEMLEIDACEHCLKLARERGVRIVRHKKVA